MKEILFIVGTGRCGTTALAEALHYNVGATVINEPRFLTDPGGLLELAQGKIELGEFRANFLTVFLPRMLRNCRRLDSYACHNIEPYRAEEIYRDVYLKSDEKIRDFIQQFTRAILSELVGGDSEKVVIKEPHAMLHAGLLSGLFEGSRFIHIIRDPRDVCSSVLKRSWGPRSIKTFTGWYNRLMSRAWINANMVDPERYKVISFETMVAYPGDVVKSVCEFAGLPLPGAVTRIDIDSAHIGRFIESMEIDEARLILHKTGVKYGWWLRLAKGGGSGY